ncbi:hypothetical protein VTO73DRAFT_7412 [Trametes versicolor]
MSSRLPQSLLSATYPRLQRPPLSISILKLARAMTVNSALPGPRVSDAAHPFDKPSADIILRSSDLVDFRVYSQILIAASPFFEGLFQVPQPLVEEQARNYYGLPIIEVSEDGETLDYLLRLCYPIKKPEGIALQVVESTLRAAMKYEMELADMLLTKNLIGDGVPRSPLEVWAIGCRLRREDIASAGGRGLTWTYKTLRHTGSRSLLPDLESTTNLEAVTAGQLFRICNYIDLCPSSETASDFRFIDPSPTENVVGALEEDFRSTDSLHMFADISSADVSCRSSDGVVFHAHQAVLRAASSVLRMKVAQRTTSDIDESREPGDSAHTSNPERSLPVLQFEETSQVLPHLIAYCYPAHIPTPLPNLPQLLAVLSAVARHEIAIARRALLAQWSEAASTNPLRAYFLAIQAGDADCAKAAARHVLRGPVEGVYVQEMESSPALAYLRLLLYYQSCKDMAERGILGEASLGAPDGMGDLKKGSRKMVRHGAAQPRVKSGDSDSEPWLQTYMKNLWMTLERHPHPSFLPTMEQLLIASTSGDNQPWCDNCSSVASTLVVRSNDLRALRDAMEKVDLAI